MRHFDYAIFDLDGTLLDTREGVIAAVIKTIKENGKKVPHQDILEGMIGPPMQWSFKMLFNISDENAMRMANQFRDYYQTDNFLLKAEPYDGIFELLCQLLDSGVKVGIATYKREDYAKRLLSEKGFNKYTSYIYGSDLKGKLKKDDIIRTCLRNMGCYDYSKGVYIGDGKSDGEGSNAIGINFIAVTYGFDFKNMEDVQNYYPFGVAKNCKEIGDLILR